MLEGGYQKKIIDSIKAIGGTAFTGQFPTGQADLVCGWPKDGRLLYLEVEVKTKENYHRVMQSMDLVKGRYIIKDDCKSLKKHEYLQITKINNTRANDGLALLAYSFEQVKEYIDGQI